MPIKTLFLLPFLFASAFCGAVIVEYKNGETEKIKKAAFKEKVHFRTKGRSIEINPKKLNDMYVFSDTIEIYYGETWVRANVYPTTKDTVNIPVHEGWIKINTILTGVADFGKTSALIPELKHIKFKIPKPKRETASLPPTVAFTDSGVEENPEESEENLIADTENAEEDSTAGEDENRDENLTDDEDEKQNEQ